MKKTKKTPLTDEVRDALLELKNIPWDQFPLERVGYAPQNYPGVRKVLMNSMLNIEFIGKFLVMLDEGIVESKHMAVLITGYTGNPDDIEAATYNLKMNLAETKPAHIPWRELALEYGYVASSGSFSRAIKGRRWAPVEMIYMLCKKFEQESVTGESNGVTITFMVK